MEFYVKLLWGLSTWTLLEGSMVLLSPAGSIRLANRFFPKWGKYLEDMETSELRKMGAIELIFGVALAVYLLLFA